MSYNIGDSDMRIWNRLAHDAKQVFGDPIQWDLFIIWCAFMSVVIGGVIMSAYWMLILIGIIIT